MLENICFNCFHEKSDSNICPICGYENNTSNNKKWTLGNSLIPGTILKGHFLTGKTLGQGGFGITYLALDLNTNSKVAIKEFFPSHLVCRDLSKERCKVIPVSAKDEEVFLYGLYKFKEEAELLATFRHDKNIVSISQFFRENNTGYFVMEYIDGISLKEYVKKMKGRVLFPDAVGILEPVMNALISVHQRGLIHRDISPDNISIKSDGTVKLIDFGAARFFIEARGRGMTTILKPGYAPPEQYSTNGKQGPWTDVYAIGATLYYAVTGKAPLDSISRKVEDEIIMPSKINNSITSAQESVLMQSLFLDHSARFQNMSLLRDALLMSIQPSKNINEVIQITQEKHPVEESPVNCEEDKVKKIDASPEEIEKPNNNEKTMGFGTYDYVLFFLMIVICGLILIILLSGK